MDKDLRGLVIEIISIIIMMVIIIPICANASSEYNRQKEVLLSGVGTSVDITHNGDMKRVTIYSNYNEVVKVNLILKISKFANDYDIYFDKEVYDIDELRYIEDDNYRYYQLGIYEVDEYRDFDFKLKAKGSLYYDETITYSFVTEGLL